VEATPHDEAAIHAQTISTADPPLLDHSTAGGGTVRPAAGPNQLLILIPAFNEAGAISDVIREVRQVMPTTPILVVDDASKDATYDRAKAAGGDVLRLPHHLGLGGCVQAGYKLAFELGYEYVIRVDGDGQHDPKYIPDLLKVLRQTGCHMVIGSRFYQNNGAHTSAVRALGIWMFRIVLRPILGQPVHDPTSGFVGVNREALQVFTGSFPLEYPEIEALVVLQRKKFRFQEVPVQMRRRKAGRSTITAVKSLYYVVHVLLGVFVNVLKFEGRRRKE
jgi:glycosyltransferase involved in cell wall biosynthesis